MRTAKVSGRGAARWRQRQHPWIYRSDVKAVPEGGAGVVRVVDERGAVVGMALWSPHSQISLRLLTHAEVTIDVEFWRGRLETALARRQGVEASGYRLAHAEADGLPSLVADVYGPYVVVQLLSAGLEAVRPAVLEALVAVVRPEGVLARNDVRVREHERLERAVEILHGAVPPEVEVHEGPVAYAAAPWEGQKTGAFLDQRENRLHAGGLARGRALDCFAYHGSFALHLARGAREVVALDSSGPALERAGANAVRNGFAARGTGVWVHEERDVVFRTVEANAFDRLRALEAAGDRFDTIVLDPPAFAKRRDALEAAVRGYKELNLRAMRLLAPGGHLCTFSCSFHMNAARFREMLESAAADAGRPLRWVETRGQPADHPEIVQIPESGYLKGAVLQAV
jgi:23S rRNA (cytosine1962-C5)-methyltransferase